MANYIGRVAEVKDHKSIYFACTGIIREHRNGVFHVELPEGVKKFERGEIRIKRLTEADYNVRLVKDEDDLRMDATTDEVDAENWSDAITQATGGEEYAKITVSKGSTKGEPGKPHTKPRTEPQTRVANSLESLSYPYTIALPASYAPLLERKTKGIYGLSTKKRYGRIYITVESAEALTNLYKKLDTKRKSVQSRTILEGIRSSMK